MALEKEIWRTDIVSNLYKDNDFMKYATIADQYVLAGKVVHIPNANSASGVVKNRSSLPASVTKRTDIDVTYALDEYTTNPVLIPNIDDIQLSYDKRQSVMQEDRAALNQLVAEWMLRSWAPTVAAQYLRTTGAAVVGAANGATGNRKGLTKEDVRKARTKLNKQNAPKDGRVALIPSDQMDFLLSDSDLLKRDYAGEIDMKGGVISRLFGFELLERSTVLEYDNATTPVVQDPGASGAAANNQAALFWHPFAVERALGTVDIFSHEGAPTYYGDILSFLLMAGGRQRRNDGAGIVAVIEAASA
ncbi:phage capsid protein [Spirosoma aerolatum]|uniref:phage capsid protein n=1 Tax=Spirosoma aerolatum TaxID=1211326 RepID=UPI0009AF060D|nr:phage capsid protein [Spirosoma aerolatum]